jgi:regulator of PEP synthase PpsR (kinase-PPPase family)
VELVSILSGIKAQSINLKMKKKVHILLLSDSTGETVNSIASTVMSQFPQCSITVELIPFLRTLSKVNEILPGKSRNADFIIHSLVDKNIILKIKQVAEKHKVQIIELLVNPLKKISAFTGISAIGLPGKQHTVNTSYFNRIDAIDFAMYTDDGRTGERLLLSDVIVLGISRTSKTPTCIYLAYQGIRAANLPLLINQKLPNKFYMALSKGVPVVGLVASITRLKEIRS